jgi:hypothetical protein
MMVKVVPHSRTPLILALSKAAVLLVHTPTRQLLAVRSCQSGAREVRHSMPTLKMASRSCSHVTLSGNPLILTT